MILAGSGLVVRGSFFFSWFLTVVVWFTLDRVDRLGVVVVRFSGALRKACELVWFVGFSCECVV